MSLLKDNLPISVQNIKSLSEFEGYMALITGLIANATSEVKFGHCPDLPADTKTDVWELGKTIPLYVFPSSNGESIEMFSTSTDTNDIHIKGLDANGLPQIKIVALSGTATVAGVVPIPGTWVSVTRAKNDDSTDLTGQVTIRKVGGPEIYAFVDIDDQQTSQTPYVVPSNKVAIINNFSTAFNKSGGTNVSAIFTLAIQEPGKTFLGKIRYGLQNNGTSNISSDLVVPILVGPLGRIKVTANSTFGPADVSGEYSMILVDKDSIDPAILAAL